MNHNFRFAVVSDLHIGLPHTIWDHPSRFHLVEVSIPALERVLTHLETLNLDFILLPGDLTQHGEPENHQWLQKRLQSVPFPVYVVPGNHDVTRLLANEQSIGLADFSNYYQKFGYDNPQQLYYSHEIIPGVQLIGLNSNQFDEQGKQIGYLDEQQLIWLEKTLCEIKDKLILVMVHHNIVEHLPGQAKHELGKRYMADNAPQLLEILKKHQVKLIFTGHLHVQDIAYEQGIYEITTGSLVSYPHPYRIIEVRTNLEGNIQLDIQSYKIDSLPSWENLGEISREWMGERSFPFMVRLVTSPPLSLPIAEAEKIAPQLRYFWADIASGDGSFDFPEFPLPLRLYLQQFSAVTPIDNQASLLI